MVRIPSSVIEFSRGDATIFEAFADYYNEYASNQGVKGLAFSNAVAFAEKESKLNELFAKEVYSRAGLDFGSVPLAHVANNPNVQWAAFSIISAMVDVILPQTLVDTIGMYTDIKVGGFGDSFAFDIEPRNLFLTTKFSNGKRFSEMKRQFKGQVTVVPEPRAITVYTSLYNVLAGKESLAAFAMKAAKSLETQMTIDAYEAFNAAMAEMQTYANTELYVSGYTQDALVKMAQTVTAYNNGSRAVIVGTRVALSKVLPSGDKYRFMLDSEYVRMGYIQNAFGYDVMELPQVAKVDAPFGLVLDDTKLYVISPASQKLLKLCIEGDTTSYTNQAYDNADLTQATVLVKRYAVALATNSVFGIIQM